jgi:hypothetical protein
MPPNSEDRQLSAQSAVDLDAMEKYGIVKTSVDCFHYREFRYSNLQDAVAQATYQAGLRRHNR